MKSRFFRCLQLAFVTGCIAATAAQAGEPVVGVDVGAAMPTSKFRKTADTGGAIAPFFGYSFGDRFSVALLGQAQFAGFPTDVDKDRESDMTSLFSFTAGPRFSLRDDPIEVYFGAQGGVYAEVTGPLDDSAGGFNFGGGLGYELSRGTVLGLFAARHQADMRGARGDTADLSFVTAGLSLNHRFLAPPPPPPPPVVAAAPPPPPPVKKKIILRGVNFDFDKATIRPDARVILDEAASTLQQERGIAVVVEGHTDSMGSEAYNDKLSVRRATAVQDYLVGKGISAARMTIEGYGESKPVASNTTADGRAQNRRVELRVTQQPQ